MIVEIENRIGIRHSIERKSTPKYNRFKSIACTESSLNSYDDNNNKVKIVAEVILTLY